MNDKLRATCESKGVFLRREAEVLGYDQRALRIQLQTGLWHRVRHGAYTFGDIWNAADQRQRHRILARAAYRTARTAVALSHASAVLEHTDSFWGLDLSEVDLTRLDGKSGRREAGLRQHRGKLLDGDVIEVDGVQTTSPTRAALELTTVANTEQSLVVVNGLLHSGLCTLDGLIERYSSMDKWPNTLGTDLVLRLADRKIESVGETRTFYLCWKFGVPAPTPQLRVLDDRGLLRGRVDFAWPAYGVFLEFDGLGKYIKYLRDGETPADAVIREKKREDLIRSLTGWRCIRLTWADLSQPDATAARILRELSWRKSA
jgi:hypothetical protein